MSGFIECFGRCQQQMEKVLQYVRQRVAQSGGVFKPIIITDIDGVLLRGHTPIPGTLEAVRQLMRQSIPLACLTNGGGQLQSLKVKKMNDIFGQQLFSSQNMFMNHSPMRPYLLKHSKEPGVLLVSGSLRITDILDDLGITNYATADELYALFHKGEPRGLPSQTGFIFHQRSYQPDAIIARLQKRLKLSVLPSNYHQWGQIINSIFALNDVSPYETTLEVIHNVFAQKQKRSLPLPPYFAAQNDIVWAGGYHRPRLAFGPFNYMLQEHCQRHNFQLTKRYFGKPEPAAFQFVEDYMKDKYGDGCFFMVGDNPRADIRGANRVQWASFLTQTGVHAGQANDPENPATQVVSNFQQAMETVIRIKRDKLYI